MYGMFILLETLSLNTCYKNEKYILKKNVSHLDTSKLSQGHGHLS